MEYSYISIPDWYARNTFMALDDRVAYRCKTLISDVNIETSYKDMSQKVVVGKIGNSSWGSLALAFALLAVLFDIILKLTFPTTFDVGTRQNIFAMIIILSVICFSLRFIQEDYVWFYDNTNNVEFAIKVSGKDRNRAEKFVEFIQEKIRGSNSSS